MIWHMNVKQTRNKHEPMMWKFKLNENSMRIGPKYSEHSSNSISRKQFKHGAKWKAGNLETKILHYHIQKRKQKWLGMKKIKKERKPLEKTYWGWLPLLCRHFVPELEHQLNSGRSNQTACYQSTSDEMSDLPLCTADPSSAGSWEPPDSKIIIQKHGTKVHKQYWSSSVCV